jgi:hypothetical protein
VAGDFYLPSSIPKEIGGVNAVQAVFYVIKDCILGCRWQEFEGRMGYLLGFGDGSKNLTNDFVLKC